MKDSVKSSSQKENKYGQSGRVLFCRKCECHGLQVILKGHAPKCPYELCDCHACGKLMNKRMRSFEKRNGDLIRSAQRARKEMQSISPSSSISDNDQEMQSNGKPMTVMSYEIWKLKCAQEKKEREANKKEEEQQPVSRKRTYPFGDEAVRDHSSPSPSSTQRGTYVNLPTIPPVRVLVDADKKTVIVPESKAHSSSPSPSRLDGSSPSTSTSPLRPRVSSISTPLPTHPSHVLAISSTSITTPSTSSYPSTSIPQPMPISIPSSLPVSLHQSIPQSLPSSFTTPIPSSSSSFPTSDMSSLFQSMPTSLLLRNCAMNHERMQKGLPPVMNLSPAMPTVSQGALPLAPQPTHSVESSLLSQLATLLGSQSSGLPQTIPPITTSTLSMPSLAFPQIPSSTFQPFIPTSTVPVSLPAPKLDTTAFPPEVLQLLNHNLVNFLPQ